MNRTYARYDDKDDVIDIDLTGLQAIDVPTVDAAFKQIRSVAERYPGRYAIACWTDVKIGSADVAAHFGKLAVDLQSLVKATIRYGANDPLVRSYVRSEAAKHHRAGVRSNFYETREQALAVVKASRESER